MHGQRHLNFDAPRHPRHPRARATDARSSHEAAAAVEASGLAAKQTAQVLDALARFPNCTSRELAEYAGLDRYMVARRLPEAYEDGHVTRSLPTPITAPCAFSAKRVIRWSPR